MVYPKDGFGYCTGGGGIGEVCEFVPIAYPAGAGTEIVWSYAIPEGRDVEVHARWHIRTPLGECLIGHQLWAGGRMGNGGAVELAPVSDGAPFYLSEPLWAPTIALNGNTAEVRVTADAAEDMTGNLRVCRLEDPNPDPPPFTLGAVVAICQPIEGFVFVGHLGVHVDPTNPGYCDEWTDQCGNVVMQAATDPEDPQIVLYGGTIPALDSPYAGMGLTSVGKAAGTATSHTFYVVHVPYMNATRAVLHSVHPNGGNTDEITIYSTSAVPGVGPAIGTTFNSIQIVYQAGSGTNPNLQWTRVELDAVAQTSQIDVNNVLQAAGVDYTTPTVLGETLEFADSPGMGYIGTIVAIIYAGKKLSSSERTIIEGYLHTQWPTLP